MGLTRNALQAHMVGAAAVVLLAACSHRGEPQPKSAPAAGLGPKEGLVTAIARDGVVVSGERYFGGLADDAPLIHLFHQGRADGRGEYAPLVGWLNEHGYRAIAWDLRAGGDVFGGENRTAATVGDAPAEYCDAYADVEAALTAGAALAGRAPVIVWGSSYSGALVFQAAAKLPDKIAGVLAFSPAAGGPLAACRAGLFLDRVTAPAAVFRPASEMALESAQAQRAAFEAARVSFHVIEGETHGSSMLVDSRAGADRSAARALVMEWLDHTVGKRR
ncbi:MAG: alpha/beta hydrolase [Kofleriaceae bacterium]